MVTAVTTFRGYFSVGWYIYVRFHFSMYVTIAERVPVVQVTAKKRRCGCGLGESFSERL